MKYIDLVEQVKTKKSFLCIGLDTDLSKIPSFLLEYEDPIFEFNKKIVDATADYAVAYKPNIAFYESVGAKGWLSLEKTAWYIKSKFPNIFVIADAKRGDIGNTSKMYAKAFFKSLNFDAITLSPYMGKDSIEPYLEFENKWVLLLALTSNESAADFQLFEDKNKAPLFKKVLETASKWSSKDQMMFVIGATKANMLKKVREVVPDHFLLIPGIGSQGGNFDDVVKYGMNENCGLIVNASRSIIYADQTDDFAQGAREQARLLKEEMAAALEKKGII